MNITLQPDVQRFVEEKVQSGEYASPQDAVNELLARVRDEQAMTPEEIAELREEIDAGIADADRGNFIEFSAEDVIAERRAALAARQKGA